jgi:hypothetical protein
MTKGEARRKLRACGKRRKSLKRNEELLAEDIREAVAAARLARVPMEEAAELLDLNRTTIYQVYLDQPDSRQPAAA